MQMNFHRKLPIPQEVKKEYPLTERMEKVKMSLLNIILFPLD